MRRDFLARRRWIDPKMSKRVLDANWRGLGPVLIVCTNNQRTRLRSSRQSAPRERRPDPRAEPTWPVTFCALTKPAAIAARRALAGTCSRYAGDPDATELTAPDAQRRRAAHVSTAHNGAPTVSGDRFACPDNIFIDSRITSGSPPTASDGVFADCNDGVLVTFRRRRRSAPDEALSRRPRRSGDLRSRSWRRTNVHSSAQYNIRAETDVAGADIADLRWTRGRRAAIQLPGRRRCLAALGCCRRHPRRRRSDRRLDAATKPSLCIKRATSMAARTCTTSLFGPPRLGLPSRRSCRAT